MSKENLNPTNIANVPAENWQALANKKIFFAHMSVGLNIIDGIRDVMKEHDQIKLNIVETSSPGDMTSPIFAHATLGHNTDPLAKIESFKTLMASISRARPDIAFLKFCYVDIYGHSDTDNIFNAYTKAVAELRQQNPNTAFLHVTTPLCSVPTSLKNRAKMSIKTLIGKDTVVDDNANRDNYNKLLKNAYAESGHIFDLTRAESTDVTGSSCYAKKGKQEVPMMISDYTTDGGHLNEKGRKIVAEQLLIKLAMTASER
jgi:lysophospholipase L1-like esterase